MNSFALYAESWIRSLKVYAAFYSLSYLEIVRPHTVLACVWDPCVWDPCVWNPCVIYTLNTDTILFGVRCHRD